MDKKFILLNLALCLQRVQPASFDRYLIGWFTQSFSLIQREQFISLRQLDCTEIWTFEIHDERSPRFRQWITNDGITWTKSNYWLVRTEDYINGFDPNINHQFIYGIKCMHNVTADKIVVLIENEADAKDFSNLGVDFLVLHKSYNCTIF